MNHYASWKWLPYLAILLLTGSAAVQTFPSGKLDGVRSESIVRKRYAMDPPHFAKDPAVKMDYDIV